MRKFTKQALALALTAAMALQPVTSPVAAKAADTNVSITINGYQISSYIESAKSGGYRTIYSIDDPSNEIAENADGSDKVGMIYGIEGVSNPEDEMVVNSTSKYVKKEAATVLGKDEVNVGGSSTSSSYVMTMAFGDVISSFYETKLYMRAYAQKKDGTYVYSGVKSMTVYKLADYLYQNRLMSNAASHDYLYNDILSAVKSSYGKVDFDYHQSIVHPDDEDNTTVAPTKRPDEETTEKPTEAPSIELPTGDENPDDSDEIINLSKGKTVTASSATWEYTADKAVDGNVDTYWEGQGGNQTLSINLGADADLSYVIIKLNPSSAWGARTQTIEVLGHTQYETGYKTMVPATGYQFDPASGNQIKIPVTGKASDVQLKFVSNTGSGSGQAAEVEIYGIPADNPDFVITNMTTNKASLYENEDLVIAAVVKNKGTLDAAATTLTFYMNDREVATADVKALKAGESTTIQINAGTCDADEYVISAKVDETNAIIERNEDNNSFEMPNKVTVKEVDSSDIVPVLSWLPSNPSRGSETTFSVGVKNQGNQPTGDSSRKVTLQIKDADGNVVKTFTQTVNGKLAVNDTVNVTMGKWTAGDGKYTIEVKVDNDSAELDVKRKNNTTQSSLFVGRGANMPFTTLEAEDSANKTNGTVLKKNFTAGDFAGEASGRSAVHLDSVGEYVEFTLPSAANALVMRNGLAEGVNGTVSLYIDNADKGNFDVSTKYSYVYTNGTAKGLDRIGYENSGDKAFWLYEDAQLMLDQTYPAGTKIRVQLDSSDVQSVYVDMFEIEKVDPAITNPNPDKYVEVSSSMSVKQAVEKCAQDSSKVGVFIPAGEWELDAQQITVQKTMEIIGAGPWHTKLVAPKNETNSNSGFTISENAAGTTIKDLSAWGNYVNRNDGPGKFLNGDKMKNVTVDNVWVEHFVCLFWGVGSCNNTFRNCRIKNLFADGINMTNSSNNNLLENCYARGTGDDSFALFSAADNGGSYNIGNVYRNLTAVCTRRAACFAIYGGSGNVYKDLYGADTLNYGGITMSSLSFNYNTKGFGDEDCIIEGVTLDRCGGDFYESPGGDDKINDSQNFGAIWIFAGDREFQNVLIKDVEINEPVHFGIMLQTKYSEKFAFKNLRFINVNINDATRYGIKFVVRAENNQGPCVGDATFTNVKVNNAKVMPVYGLDRCPDFTAKVYGDGNNWTKGLNVVQASSSGDNDYQGNPNAGSGK